MHLKSLILAAFASLIFAGSAMAACYERPVITPDNAPVTRYQHGAAGNSPSFSKQGNMASILRVCTDPNSTHRFRERMIRNGACIPNGQELDTAAQPVTGSGVPIKYTTNDGVVPDYEEKRLGLLIPATKWTPEIWLPAPGPNGQWHTGSCN